MIVGYARVSTFGQARNGNSIEAQTQALKDAGCECVYTDIVSGTKLERPEFENMLESIQSGDTLVVTRLDRLGRSVSQASEVITNLLSAGIVINVLNLGILSNDSVSTLMRHILLSFAQFERDMIIERTQEGKKIARLRDPEFREGRPPKYDREQLNHAMDLLEDHSYAQVVRLTGISKSTLCREKKKRGRRNER